MMITPAESSITAVEEDHYSCTVSSSFEGEWHPEQQWAQAAAMCHCQNERGPSGRSHTHKQIQWPTGGSSQAKKNNALNDPRPKGPNETTLIKAHGAENDTNEIDSSLNLNARWKITLHISSFKAKQRCTKGSFSQENGQHFFFKRNRGFWQNYSFLKARPQFTLLGKKANSQSDLWNWIEQVELEIHWDFTWSRLLAPNLASVFPSPPTLSAMQCVLLVGPWTIYVQNHINTQEGGTLE